MSCFEGRARCRYSFTFAIQKVIMVNWGHLLHFLCGLLKLVSTIMTYFYSFRPTYSPLLLSIVTTPLSDESIFLDCSRYDLAGGSLWVINFAISPPTCYTLNTESLYSAIFAINSRGFNFWYFPLLLLLLLLPPLVSIPCAIPNLTCFAPSLLLFLCEYYLWWSFFSI